MLSYILKRIAQLIPLWFLISIVVFVLIQLPPGDYLTNIVHTLESRGTSVSQSYIDTLAKQYHLREPMINQYFYWISGVLFRGDLGQSFVWGAPVAEVIGDRMALTIAISLMSLMLTWAVAIPVGIYSAIKQYSAFDYISMFIAFIGISIPGFILVLILIYQYFALTGIPLTGLFSSAYAAAPWSFGKFLDLLKHIWLPVVLVTVNSAGAMMRNVRGLMLDELGKQYVLTARAKGLKERNLLVRYPVRMAFNPIISTIGWLLPTIIGGEVLISVVMNLQTMGPLMLRSLLSQDMYLSASFLLITSTLTIIGTLVSDILLVVMDPRIRYARVGTL